MGMCIYKVSNYCLTFDVQSYEYCDLSYRSRSAGGVRSSARSARKRGARLKKNSGDTVRL